MEERLRTGKIMIVAAIIVALATLVCTLVIKTAEWQPNTVISGVIVVTGILCLVKPEWMKKRQYTLRRVNGKVQWVCLKHDLMDNNGWQFLCTAAMIVTLSLINVFIFCNNLRPSAVWTTAIIVVVAMAVAAAVAVEILGRRDR